MIDSKKQRKAAEKFVEMWRGKTNEDEHAVQFWDELLQLVYEVEYPSQYINHEKKVRINGKPKRIDGYIRETQTLIEQKSGHVNLDLKDSQSNHANLTPFEQAERYGEKLDKDEQPRWIVVCNFHEFRIYDMNHRSAPYERILFEELPEKAHYMNFLVDEKKQELRREEKRVSRTAGELMGEFYNAMLKRIPGKPTTEDLQGLNVLCVRLVFCLYAEDAGIFEDEQFRQYLKQYEAAEIRDQLIILFSRLRNPDDRYLKPELKKFPYVNGGLFEQHEGEENFPPLDDDLRTLLLERLCKFDWSGISPANFGAVFESTLDPATRRSGGMHYTDVENIHKVIDPLFLNELREELEELKAVKGKSNKAMKTMIEQYQKKLSEVTCFDPACGSGNFLTETYLSLRRLENEAILLYTHGQKSIGDFANPVRVSISQFYGIEINGFAAKVARTALWIAENQMRKETERIAEVTDEFLPLTRHANIVEGNALRSDWEMIAPKDKVKYVIGNPPFDGYTYLTPEQKADNKVVLTKEDGNPMDKALKLDYVCCWYMQACRYMQGTDICAALVSTSSITQGLQTAELWHPLMKRYGLVIDFAWQSFAWKSESKNGAKVHCVVVGFSCKDSGKRKLLFDKTGEKTEVSYINAYLKDMEDVWIWERNKPLCSSPVMTTGNRPADGGHLIIEADDYEEFIAREPRAAKYIKRLTGSEEYINGLPRYCLWLVGADVEELMTMSEVMKRIEACRQARLKGAPDRQKLAEKPTLFREIRNPKSFLIVPATSSEKRRYVPIGFLDDSIIATNLACIVPDATEYEFGILTSSVHNHWMRAVCGRMKSDYRYSNTIVYNNFPWPLLDAKQRENIANTARLILDARARYPKSTLAMMYGENSYMYTELKEAHLANDRAVLDAYGLPYDISEEDCVKHLLGLYKALIEKSKEEPSKHKNK